jgi:coat protein Gp5
MANVIFTPTIYLKTVLMSLGDRLKIARTLSPEYSSNFGNEGAQVGNTVKVKKPWRPTVTKNSLTYASQDVSQQSLNVTVNQTASIYYGFDSFEKTLSLQDIMKNYADPAATMLAATINSDAAAYVAKNTFNAVGTPGTVPTAMSTYLSAADKLVQLGLPEGEALNLVLNRKMSSAYLDANKALFNGQSIIGKQMTTGVVENTLGYNWILDETIYTHNTGTQGGAILVNGAGQTQAGGNNATGTLNVDGVTPSITFAKAGDVFTAGNFSVHPQTRVSTGDLQQYVLLADAVSNGSGVATLSFAPAISPASADANYQNVDAALADNAPIVFWSGAGSASKASKQGLLIHKDAFAFVSVPMATPDPGEGAKAVTQTDPDTGLSLSLIQYFDGNSRTWRVRFDCLYDFAPLYRELACRIVS